MRLQRLSILLFVGVMTLIGCGGGGGGTTETVNQAPIATAQSITVNANSVNNAIILTGIDADGDTLTYMVTSQPIHGTLNGTAPNLTYTPTANYFGTDSFDFIVNDGTANSVSATVNITINNNSLPSIIVSTSSLTATVGTEITDITVDATNGGTVANYSIEPAIGNGLSFDITTGTISGTPDSTSAITRYTITATNSSGTDTATVDITIKLELPLLIIRIAFTDEVFSSSELTWHGEIFGTSEGQLNHYNNEVFYGQYQYKEAIETSGNVNDGIITVNLPEVHPGDDSNEPISNQFFLSRIKSAVSAADSFINFSVYDTNNDNAISIDELQIMFLVAGGESATGATPGVWAHAWCMYDTNAIAPIHDGVKLMDCSSDGWYSRFGEEHIIDQHGNREDATIGIIAHELGHAALLLPDLYDTDYTSEGIGDFGLMGAGSWGHQAGEQSGSTPVHMVGWSKSNLGIVTPTVVNSNTDISAKGTTTSEYNLYKIDTGVPKEYFLIENRPPSGYDRGLYILSDIAVNDSFLGGLMITHIDDNLLSNDDEIHKLVDVEEANDAGLDTGVHRGLTTNLFYNGNSNSFTNTTTPNSKRYDGLSSGLSVTAISDRGEIMDFRIDLN